MTTPAPERPPVNRRQFFRDGARLAAMTGLGAFLGVAATRSRASQNTVWQIDPSKCVYCGQCATACVLKPSAVKCVQSYEICGYCDLCTGYFVPEPNALDTGAENQACPTAAIERKFIEDPYFEYNIDESRCIGCAKCVEGCTRFGNGSFYLQVRHDRCLNCNECSIARVCAGDAFHRVPASEPYVIKTTAHE